MLHILVGASCNNNCLFCMEADREGRALHVAAQSRDDVRAMIQSYPGHDEVLFTSGEPTLCDDLVDYVAWARDKGFEIIGVISNGRRFAYRGFVARLVDAGLNRATVSIHGHEARLHDSLTRSPGSFDQTRAGLVNLVDVRRSRPFAVHTSTVVNRRNLPALPRIHRMLVDLCVDSLVFNVMMAKGRGARHLDALMPRYPDVVRAFSELCSRLDDRQLAKMKVVDVPPCISVQLPPQIRGELEDFDQYELIGSTGMQELALPSPACDNDRAPRPAPAPDSLRRRLQAVRFDKQGRVELAPRGWARLRSAFVRLLARPAPYPSTQPRDSNRIEAFSHDGPAPEAAVLAELQSVISEPDLAAGSSYYATNRRFKDRFLRAKGPPCRTCAARNRCPGVWEPYLARFGWHDFHPVADDLPCPGTDESLAPPH